MRLALLLPLLLLPVSACSSGSDKDASPPATATGAQAVAAMKADAAKLMARPESDAPRVKVQHILIAFHGAPRIPPTVTRTKEEAETTAAEVYAKVLAGEDFTRLMSEYSDDDKVVGQYLMSADEPSQAPTVYNRHDMAGAFGNVGWRLKVGEVGVATYDPDSSPFGWHIIKRLE